MGFPIAYSELSFPKIFIRVLSLLGFIRELIICLFRFMGLADILQPSVSSSSSSHQPVQIIQSASVSAALIREILPVVKFSEVPEDNFQESCAVCLYEFEADEEIRPLGNCRHIFHRRCLDPWIGYDQNTCPLCRKPLVPSSMQEQFEERVWAASWADDESYEEFSQIPGL